MSTRRHPIVVAIFFALAFMPNFCDALECARGSIGVGNPQKEPPFTVENCSKEKFVFCYKANCSSANKDFVSLGCSIINVEDEVAQGLIEFIRKKQPATVTVNLTCDVQFGEHQQSVPFSGETESTPAGTDEATTDGAKVLTPVAFVLPLVFVVSFGVVTIF
ncbi:hypothetical protein niasHS_018197 [Heterodera schachtii]|uniref:Uncharacterized protein n=1 Tax=Heterodera schachtii TaxID=97005 RepID=A0ABD2HQ93_HETSC